VVNEAYMQYQTPIVIPAKNPSTQLLKLIDGIRKHLDNPIIVVDDGSPDEYQPIFEKAIDQWDIVILQHAVNYGKGQALKTAFQYVLTEQPDNITGLVTADADGQHLASDISKVIEQRFGAGQFDYAGNSSADWVVWQAADEAIIVEPSNWVQRNLSKLQNVTEIFHRSHTGWKTWFKALRVHQYAKNLLIAVPLFAAHKMFEVGLVMQTLLGIVCFSLLASSSYLVNDILDLDSDRRHHSKCTRPIAAGELPINHALILVMVLLTFVVSLGFLLPVAARWVLLGYFFITQLYSFRLKRLLLVDVLILASLYTLRIFFGATILQTPLSEWLLLFSMFSFLSLAFLKRYNELQSISEDDHKHTGRSYNSRHLPQINIFGISSGYLAALVFALYSNSENAQALYLHPQLLWLVCPLIIYWISRIWLLASDKKLHDDPVVFAIKDRASYVLLLMVMVIGIIAYVGLPL